MTVSGRTPLHLVFGAGGQLGFALNRALSRSGRVVALGRPQVDFLRPETIVAALQEHRPSVVWNAAASTSVDALEADPDTAYRVNAHAVGVIAETARKLESVLVQFSTDYVFDGSKPDAYVEEDVASPLNVYGASKLAGERAVEQVGGDWYVLRTSWLYSVRGKNFLRTIAQKGMELNELRVVNDQTGAPTEATELAQACEALGRRLLEEPRGTRQTGVFHLAASGSTTWWGFTCAIRDELIVRGQRWKASIEPVSADQLRLPARRPANSCLSTERFFSTFGIRLRPWRDALAALPRGTEPWWQGNEPISTARLA